MENQLEKTVEHEVEAVLFFQIALQSCFKIWECRGETNSLPLRRSKIPAKCQLPCAKGYYILLSKLGFYRDTGKGS